MIPFLDHIGPYTRVALAHNLYEEGVLITLLGYISHVQLGQVDYRSGLDARIAGTPCYSPFVIKLTTTYTYTGI